MRKTLEVLNALEAEGAFRRYAIGGAVGAIFYMEAVFTDDLDVMILLSEEANPLAPLAGLHAALRARGFAERGPYVDIEDVPVQFLPAYNPLIEEAIAEAAEKDYDGVPTRVFSAEHLVAINVQTGRAKDRARFAAMHEQVPLDEGKLKSIMARHGLLEQYSRWRSP